LRRQLLHLPRQLQHADFLPGARRDLDTDRKPLRRETRGHRRRGIPEQVEQRREGPQIGRGPELLRGGESLPRPDDRRQDSDRRGHPGIRTRERSIQPLQEDCFPFSDLLT
jgi:hypothetical protein